VERYPVVIPDPHPFSAKYLEGLFLWKQAVARPIPESFFDKPGEQAGGMLTSLDIFCKLPVFVFSSFIGSNVS
jgi:hypothetical protein